MMAFSDYLLKVFLCSAVLYICYLFVLRNRCHHQWNRFYLLAALVLSILVPFIKLNFTHQAVPVNGIRLLQVVESTGNYLEEFSTASKSQSSGIQWLLISYTMIAAGLMVLFLRSIFRIYVNIRRYPALRIGKIWLISNNLPGTPYSFMNHIFWNEAIDMESATGRQIFRHELVHVQEKHSFDKLFMELATIVLWINPFFWIMKKELGQIHEFIADQRAAGEDGPAALAAMILQSVYPKHFNSLVNPFFQTSIKRRLMMLTKNQQTRTGYISRIFALALIILTVAAFTVRSRSFKPLEKAITVVIDAGHGMVDGKNSGAVSGSYQEDEINLAIANCIARENQNPNLRIILTRNTASGTSLEQRVAIAKENHANLFLSIHMGASDDAGKKGFDIYVPTKQVNYKAQSELFGSALQQELNSLQTTTQVLKRNAGIYVLDKNICPSVLVECGYITNAKDREYISSGANQQAIAKKILAAIENYAAAQ